jgi:HEAT repeat protein
VPRKNQLPPDAAFAMKQFLTKLAAGRFRSDETTMNALHALKEQGVQVEAELLRALSRAAPEKQYSIFCLLSQMKGAYPIDPLLPLLEGDFFLRRPEVMWLIARSQYKRVVDVMIGLLDDDDCIVRSEAIHCLYRPYAEKAIPYVTLALQDEDWEVRCAAVEWLAAMEHADAVETLITMLSDEDPNVRCTTAVELGKIGDKRALFALSWMEQNGPDEEAYEGRSLKRAAARAIKKIKQRYEPEVEYVLVIEESEQ